MNRQSGHLKHLDMEKTKRVRQRRIIIQEPKTISVLVIYNELQKKEIKTIEVSDLVEKFPNTTAGRVFKEHGHNIPFVRCLKAFLDTHFEGMVEPMFEIGKIDGITPKEIRDIEKLCRKKLKIKDS